MANQKISPGLKLMLICEAIRDPGRPLSHTEIWTFTGIDRVSVSRLVSDLHERHWLQAIDGRFILGEAITSMWASRLYAIHANSQKSTLKTVLNHIHPREKFSQIASQTEEPDVQEEQVP